MRWLLVGALAGVVGACAQNKPARVGAGGGGIGGAAGTNQQVVQSTKVQWKEGPASLPPGAKVAVLEGDPGKAEYFAMRVRMPDGYRVPPHWHPGVERVTVISGTFRLGMGKTFEPGALVSLPAGSYVSMPAGMRHYAAAEGETVVQIATVGPWGINYVNAEDDPRQKK